MTREQIRPGLHLTEGSCWDVFPTLGDGSVDHVITDPPYAEKTHAGARRARPGVEFTTEKLISFDSFGDVEFLRLCSECVRVAKRWVLMTCDWRHAAVAVLGDGLSDFVVRTGVWVKPDAAPQFSGDRPGTGWEAILLLHRPGRKKWNGGGHHAVWNYPVERGKHPTQKPLGLVRKWVIQFTDPGETIFDPFAGSGTTGLAAKLEGRNAELVEIDPDYCGVIRRRLDRPYPVHGPRDRKTGEDLLV